MIDVDGMPDPSALRRRRLKVWIALAVTAIAIPVVVIDNQTSDDEPTGPLGGTRVVTPVAPSPDRPESGPAKGVSVVTSSTTSSTLPITTTTTTTTLPS